MYEFCPSFYFQTTNVEKRLLDSNTSPGKCASSVTSLALFAYCFLSAALFSCYSPKTKKETLLLQFGKGIFYRVVCNNCQMKVDLLYICCTMDDPVVCFANCTLYFIIIHPIINTYVHTGGFDKTLHCEIHLFQVLKPISLPPK